MTKEDGETAPTQLVVYLKATGACTTLHRTYRGPSHLDCDFDELMKILLKPVAVPAGLRARLLGIPGTSAVKICLHSHSSE